MEVHYNLMGLVITVDTDSADFTVGTGDYTIEGWFYFNNLSATRRLCGRSI